MAGSILIESAREVYRTGVRRGGTLFCGDVREVLSDKRMLRRRGNIDLIFTSPPFPLNRKKKYGNLQGQDYVDWLAGLAPLFGKLLSKRGSIVIELGNGWEKGTPTMSTLPLEALLAFKKQGGFSLCQEFIVYNPARLPSPAQWVNIERCRLKDATTRLWWLAKTPRPKANNKRVLTGYSKSMQKLLERGTYNSGPRPSEHSISDQSFLTNNGGAIPPNFLMQSIGDLLPEILDALPQLHGVLAIPNTRSTDPYIDYCREHGLTVHPARMPVDLARFFVEFLTDPGDFVLDPFAGSNTTGFAAEEAGRRWIAIERDEQYAIASAARFDLDSAEL